MKSVIAIHGVGVVSPQGMSLAELAHAARTSGSCRSPHAAPPARNGDDWPEAMAHWNHDFQGLVNSEKKGVAALDRMTQLSIVASGDALQTMPPGDETARRSTGLILGSRAGSTASSSEFLRSTYKGLPHRVSPIQFPNTSMNCVAGQTAIWYGLTGMNATVCAGDSTGLAALHYTSRLLRLGHAKRLLAGAVEEYAPFNAWAHQAEQYGEALPFTEAAVVFALSCLPARERNGELPLAQLLGTRVHRPFGLGNETLEIGLGRQIALLLESAGCHPSDLSWFHPARWAGSGAVNAQQSALEKLAGADATKIECLEPLAPAAVGHAHGAAVMLDLALALACAPLGVGLLTCVGEAGQVGCLLVRKNQNVDAL